MTPPLTLAWLPGTFAVCRLEPEIAIPTWVEADRPPVHISRTEDELSIVLPAERVPPDITTEGPFAALRVAGTLDFSLVGILARLTTTLSNAGVSVFAISTYDTDYLLVHASNRDLATDALRHVATMTP